MKQRKPWCRLLFLLYCGVMLWLLFDRAVAELGGTPYWEYVGNSLVLKPGRTIRLFWNVIAKPEHYIELMGPEWYRNNRIHAIVNLVGNVVMFMPLGAFLPAIWKKMLTWWKTLLVSAIAITCVEILQALTLRGTCDVDDLILNSFGVWLGYVCFWLVEKLSGKKK